MSVKKINNIILIVLCFVLFAFCLTSCKADKKEHIHNWTNATCSSPKTCLSCKITDGEALGHTVRVGKCSRCNQLSDTLITNVNAILLSGQGINEQFYKTLKYIQESYDYKTDAFREMYIDYAEKEFVEAYVYVLAGINSCSAYDEFTEIKNNFLTIKTRLDSKCSQLGGTYYLSGNYQTRRDIMLEIIQSSATQIRNISELTNDWV